MRLIDIEAVLKAAELVGKEYVSIDFLKDFEQVDAVPVVRCKECKYSEPLKPHAEVYNLHLMNCTCQHGEETNNVWHKYSKKFHDYSLVKPMDYCSYGAKMEEAP